MVERSESDVYYLAARFRREEQAERVYFQIQGLVKRDSEQLDLSVFRFQLRGESIVAVIGDNPGAEVEGRLNRRLSGGEKVSLDEDTLNFLKQRRESAIQQGPWVERHYRPGQGFGFDR